MLIEKKTNSKNDIEMKIAICIIAFNRLDSIKRLIKSLEQADYNEKVTLIISIDKSNTTIVEDFAINYNWEFGEKRVITHPNNLGLRKHVLKCGNLLKEFDALIVLEDDVSVAPSFYHYAKQCTNKYKDDKNIAGISLYNFPVNYQNGLPFTALHSDSDVYLMQCAQSWGQVWMKKQWFSFINWYNDNYEEFDESPHLPKAICKWPKSSWLKYHTRYCIENHKYFIYPYVSLSTNNADVGTHYAKKTTMFQSPLLYGLKTSFKLIPNIMYDAFFENENLYCILGYKPEELCIDFYGEKENRQNKRYWLTRKSLPYQIVKSYALSFKSYELNLILNNEGNDLHLYDTKIRVNNNTKSTDSFFYQYLYSIDFCSLHHLKRQILFILRRFL